VSVKRLDRIAWGRSGRPVSASERKTLLRVLRQARREGRVQERDPEKDRKERSA
jgi:hypothetical protein